MNTSIMQRFSRLVLFWVLILFSVHAVSQNTWKINMKAAEIRNFIEQVSDITGDSFIVDPRVKGKVTVVSHADMTADEIYDMFQSVLRVHGYAAIRSGSIVKVVPTQGAKQENVRISGGLGNEEIVTRVIPVKNTNAVELVPILRPMIPQYGHLAAVRSTNALIISDHATNINRLLNIVKRIDTTDNEEVEVVKLEHAWVGDVVTLLEQLTPVQTGNKNKSSRGVAHVRVVAEERTNRLILRGERSARERVKMLVAELDQPMTSTGSTQVIYLRHADAVKVAEILNSLVSGQAVTPGQPVRRTSNSRSNRVSQARRSPASMSGNNKLMIQADETLNALVVKASPAELAEIKDIVDQLDVRRAQVLIEAAVVEITGDAGKAVGIQWGAVDDQNLVGGVNFTNVGNSLNSIIKAATTTAAAATAGLASGLTLGGGKVGKDGKVEFAMIIQALNNAANTNLLSTPSLMTLDNEEAQIVVGQNVPFVTGKQLSSSNDNPFQTIERKDVGLTLKVTPQINDGDVVRLQVEQETSSVNDTALAVKATDVITSKRAINTTVLVNDGSIVALGGLMEETVRGSESKVPLLGDLPLLGALFRSSKQSHIKTNLLVLLQPTIIRNAVTAEEIVKRKYKMLRSVNMQLDEVGNLKVVGKDIYPDSSKDLIRHGLGK